MKGSTFKRCGCTVPVLDDQGNPVTGTDGRIKQRQLGKHCPKLRRPNGSWSRQHGTWYALLNLPPMPGAGPQRIRHGGLPSQTDAEQLLADVQPLLALAQQADHPGQTRTTIVNQINAAFKARRPLPSYDQLRGKVLVGQPLDQQMRGRSLSEPHVGFLLVRYGIAAVTEVSTRCRSGCGGGGGCRRCGRCWKRGARLRWCGWRNSQPSWSGCGRS